MATKRVDHQERSAVLKTATTTRTTTTTTTSIIFSNKNNNKTTNSSKIKINDTSNMKCDDSLATKVKDINGLCWLLKTTNYWCQMPLLL